MSAGTAFGEIPGDQLAEEFHMVYAQVYGQSPNARYVGNQWYMVNGEAVHVSMLQREIDRLAELARMQKLHSSRRNIVQRLISKLRTS